MRVWMIIHPLAQAAIFALILAEVMAAELPRTVNSKFAYAIYLLSGMVAVLAVSRSSAVA